MDLGRSSHLLYFFIIFTYLTFYHCVLQISEDIKAFVMSKLLFLKNATVGIWKNII